MRRFDKVREDQFLRDASGLGDPGDLGRSHAAMPVPRRATGRSAGYDLCTPVGFELAPGEQITVPTGLKVYMEADEVFLINVRSGQGFRYGLRLMNTQGWIDADYADNTANEGHILVALRNEGDRQFVAQPGQAVAQGMFVRYLVTDDDQPAEETRRGGMGSTG